MRHLSPNAVLLLTAVTVLTSDQLSKWWATTAGLVVLNKGISFGLFEHPLALWIVIMVGVGIVSVVALKNAAYRHHPVIWGAIAGGSLANLVDRIVFGGVRDWIPIPFTSLTNNLADWALVSALLIWTVLEYSSERTES